MSAYEYQEGWDRGKRAGYIAALRDLVAVANAGGDAGEAAAKTLKEITGE